MVVVAISGVQPSRSTSRAERDRGGLDEKTCFQLAGRHQEGAPENDVPGPKDAILKADEAQGEKVSVKKPAKGGSQLLFAPERKEERRAMGKTCP